LPFGLALGLLVVAGGLLAGAQRADVNQAADAVGVARGHDFFHQLHVGVFEGSAAAMQDADHADHGVVAGQ